MHMFDFLVTLALGIFMGVAATVSIAYSLEQRAANKLREKQNAALGRGQVGTMSLVRYPPIDRSPSEVFDYENSDTPRRLSY